MHSEYMDAVRSSERTSPRLAGTGCRPLGEMQFLLQSFPISIMA